MPKKTGLASISQGGSEIHRVDPRLLKVRDSWNSRDFNDPENSNYVEELCSSISEVGVKEPLTVTWERGEAYIDDGECRYRATMLAIKRGVDIKTVPVKAEERYASELDRLVNQRLRNSGKPFTVFEDAKHFKKMLDLGMKQEEIARKANISNARVSQILDFNTMPQAVKGMVINGDVSPSLAMQVTKEAGTEAEKQLKKAMTAAAAEGKTKIKPSHIAETGGSVKFNAASAVKDAIEYSDIDDSDNDVVVIKMPMDKWEIIRQGLKL